MKNVLRIVAGLIGILFFLNGLQWIINPAIVVEIVVGLFLIFVSSKIAIEN